jgi:hypothetical protein
MLPIDRQEFSVYQRRLDLEGLRIRISLQVSSCADQFKGVE